MDSVIFTIIGAAIALSVAILNWATAAGEKGPRRWHQHLVLLAAVFTAYGTWRAFLLNEQKTWDQVGVQFQSDWLQRKQLKERLAHERELRSKADEIAELNRTIAASVTGGDSFVELFFIVFPKSNDAMLTVAHHGKFPVFDVLLEVADRDEMNKRAKDLGIRPNYSGPSSMTLDQVRGLVKPKATFNIPIIRPKLALRIMDSWQLPNDRNSVRYRIAIYTRNGNFSQSLNLARIDGSWTQASRVLKLIGSGKMPVLVHESIPPDYPRGSNGRINWEG